MEVLLAIILIFGGVHAAKKAPKTVAVVTPSCDASLRFAERDLSGETTFVAGQMIYRTEDGDICKG